MGYNTVAVIMNDALGAIEGDPAIGEGISRAVRNWHGRDRDRFSVEVDARSGRGCHGRAIAIISQDHADGEQVTIVHGNTGWTADEAEPGKHTALSWRGLDQMQRCLERHGYKVTKPERKRKPKAVKLTVAEAEFVAEMNHEVDSENRWQNFDPDFRQKDIARLLRRGWFERHTDLNGFRQYRWTEAGRLAIQDA